MLDYKDVTFSFQERKTRVRRRRLGLVLLLFLAGAIWLGLRWWRARAAVNEVQELLLAGRLDAAEERLRQAGSPLFLGASVRELRALAGLCRGREDEAVARFAELRRAGTRTALRAERFLAHFFDRGEASKLRVYSDYLLPLGGDEVRWYHALGRASSLDANGTEADVAGLSPAFQEANAKALNLLAAFTRSLRAGRVDYIFDCNDLPLAYYDLQRRVTRPLVPGIAFTPFDAQFKQGARRFRLSLDGGLQRKIDRLFQKHAGTLVLLDLPENAIAAAYSKPRRPGAENAAFGELFAPGSIVKIVSLLAFLRNGRAGIFPLECPGYLAIGGDVIYELEKHGAVPDFSQALARSCNVAFARMSRAVGSKAMAAMLRLFLFNAPPLRDQFCSFALGRFDEKESGELPLARLSSGLGGVSMTTVHAAVVASLFAQNGRLFPPYLVDDVKNILGLGLYSHESRPRTLLADDLNFLRVRKAMAAVVEDESGTGRRARGRMRLAVKTGTTGSSAGGLDAVIAGFVPCEKPRFAFAFRLEGGGRADVEGALFLADLVNVLYPEAP